MDDLKKLARIGKSFPRRWRERVGKAVDELARMQNDSTPWSERTVAHSTNLKVIELAAAEERAKKQATSLTLNLGMVRIPVAIPNQDQWEAFAQSADRPALEAVVIEPDDNDDPEAA